MPDDIKKRREEIERLTGRCLTIARSRFDEATMTNLIVDNEAIILAALRAMEALPNAVKLLEIAQGILESEGFETAKEIGDFLAVLASRQTPKGEA